MITMMTDSWSWQRQFTVVIAEPRGHVRRTRYVRLSLRSPPPRARAPPTRPPSQTLHPSQTLPNRPPAPSATDLREIAVADHAPVHRSEPADLVRAVRREVVVEERPLRERRVRRLPPTPPPTPTPTPPCYVKQSRDGSLRRCASRGGGTDRGERPPPFVCVCVCLCVCVCVCVCDCVCVCATRRASRDRSK